MKKFLACFDGLRFAPGTLSYALDLAQKAGAHLVGVFIEDPHLHSYHLAEMQTYSDESFEGHLRALNRQDDEKRQTSIDNFRHACAAAGVPCSVHRDRNTPVRELLHESIYADLLIIRANEGLRNEPRETPASFVREVAQEARCPVLLVPDHYRHIQAVHLLYDGSPASVGALRAFSYLFADYHPAETEVITVKSSGDYQHLPDGRLIKEYAKRHFPQATFTVLRGLADEAIIRYVRHRKKEALLVLGAHRRNALTRLFRTSLGDELLRHLKMPLFIACEG